MKRSISSATAVLVIGICAALAMPTGVALAADDPLCELLGLCFEPPPPPPPTSTTPTDTAPPETTPTTTSPTTTSPTTPTAPTTTTAPPRECLLGVGEVDRRQVGPIELREPMEGIRNAVRVPPRKESPGLLRYCVRGGGRVDVTFTRGRAALIVARAQGYRYRGHGIGDSTSRLKKGKLGAKRAGSEGYRIGKVLIGSEDGFVTFIAPARGALLDDRGALEHHLKRVGLD